LSPRHEDVIGTILTELFRLRIYEDRLKISWYSCYLTGCSFKWRHPY